MKKKVKKLKKLLVEKQLEVLSKNYYEFTVDTQHLHKQIENIRETLKVLKEQKCIVHKVNLTDEPIKKSCKSCKHNSSVALRAACVSCDDSYSGWKKK